MDNSQIENTINEIRKRSGAVTAFNKDKISNAIFRALAATSKADRGLADQLADNVVNKLVVVESETIKQSYQCSWPSSRRNQNSERNVPSTKSFSSIKNLLAVVDLARNILRFSRLHVSMYHST